MLKMIRFKLESLMKKRGYVDDKGRLMYRKLARDTGVSYVWLWKIGSNQKGINPSMEVLDRLCEHFKCKPGDILEFKKNKGEKR